MAFDMYAGSEREKIEHREEELFTLISEDHENYPVLNEIWEDFYNGPRISYGKANLLTHELLKLQAVIERQKKHVWLSPTLNRLARFFSSAYTKQQQIDCKTD